MDNSQYAATQTQIMLIAKIVKDMPLDEFIEAGEKADGIGPILDPTLWRIGHENLERIIQLARKLKVFQNEIKFQIDYGVISSGGPCNPNNAP